MVPPSSSVKKNKDNDENVCKEVHSHKRLPEIFEILWGYDSILSEVAPRGSFTDHVFRLIMFHQSLIGLPKYQSMTTLS